MNANEIIEIRELQSLFGALNWQPCFCQPLTFCLAVIVDVIKTSCIFFTWIRYCIQHCSSLLQKIVGTFDLSMKSTILEYFQKIIRFKSFVTTLVTEKKYQTVHFSTSRKISKTQTLCTIAPRWGTDSSRPVWICCRSPLECKTLKI